jgi:hypothetical protein
MPAVEFERCSAPQYRLDRLYVSRVLGPLLRVVALRVVRSPSVRRGRVVRLGKAQCAVGHQLSQPVGVVGDQAADVLVHQRRHGRQL